MKNCNATLWTLEAIVKVLLVSSRPAVGMVNRTIASLIEAREVETIPIYSCSVVDGWILPNYYSDNYIGW